MTESSKTPAASAFESLTDAEGAAVPSLQRGLVGYVALIWGLGGVIGLLTMAIVRLLAISIDAFGFSLTWTHWLVFFISVLFMAYAEGYRTFQKTWAPRVVQRAFQLQHEWTPVRLLLAPFYCMSFFHATRKRRLTAWITTICIVLLIVLMNRIAQPWRGLIDAGVVVGLSWGVVCLILQTFSQRLTNLENNKGSS
ncbi:MAG: hypothetical protein AB8B97_10140 [Granulosicoccus sp.]